MVRKLTVAITVLGIALVVFVYMASLMLSRGLKVTLASTGSPDNLIVIRSGASNEIQSSLTREQSAIILTDPGVSRGNGEVALASLDNLVLIALRKRSDNQLSNVNVRGISALSLELRPEIKVVAGRLPALGSNEIMVGISINRKFSGTDLGDSIRLVGSNWPVVGIFDAGNSAFSSEIWGDAEVLMPAYKRTNFSSLTFRMSAGSDFESIKSRLENDPRMSVTIKRERDFYADQSEALALFINILGTFVSIFFSLGAIIGAMITMYSAVGNRIREIGVLRALGFSSFAVFLAFLKESLLLALLGGLLGCCMAATLLSVGISTSNFMTFSEIAFGFSIDIGIIARGIVFALIMGFLGGALPALKASRLKITEALRSH
jgi:ABC-type antimicrobial peptide transport system permease subunit